MEKKEITTLNKSSATGMLNRNLLMGVIVLLFLNFFVTCSGSSKSTLTIELLDSLAVQQKRFEVDLVKKLDDRDKKMKYHIREKMQDATYDILVFEKDLDGNKISISEIKLQLDSDNIPEYEQ